MGQLADVDIDLGLGDLVVADHFAHSRGNGGGNGGGSPLVSAPTHPNQVGLAGIGRNRDTYSWPNVHTSSVSIDSGATGTVIEDTKFQGEVILTDGVSDVTFRRCWFMGNPNYTVRKSLFDDGLGCLFEDSDFEAHGVAKNYQHGCGGVRESVWQRCLFYNGEDCFKLGTWGESHVIDSWLQVVRPDDTAHPDCLQFGDNLIGKVFVLRSTLETRSWQIGGTRLHAMEELDGGATREHAGNSALQTKPCGAAGCDPGDPPIDAYFSILDSIVTGGNYIMDAENCHGEFKRNVVIRGAGHPTTDLGVRNGGNVVIPTSGADVNRFYDDGEVYTGGALNPNGETDPGPIPLLGL